jgi:putative PIN family toxin of toxin-antitoxin system
MTIPQIVMDTNVLIAALRSRRGASYRLLTLIDSGKFQINISVPLALEYEDVTKRLIGAIPLNQHEIDDILDYICAVANHSKVYYLWRPFLKDPKDDMILELAVAANCDTIVTYNKKDFQGIQQFGIHLVSAKEFLEGIGEL